MSSRVCKMGPDNGNPGLPHTDQAPKVGNYLRSASIVGRDWAIDVHLVAENEDAYKRAKQAIADLVNSEEVNIWQEPS